MSGVSTNNLPSARIVQSVLGNSNGSTVQIDVSALIALVMGGTGPGYATAAQLQADWNWPAGSIGTVWGDTNPSLIGVWRKEDASGSGHWVRIGDLPLTNLAQGLVDDLMTRFSALSSGVRPRGNWSAASGAFPSSAIAGDMWYVSEGGSVDGQIFMTGDRLVALIEGAATGSFSGQWAREAASSVVGSLEAQRPLTMGSLLLSGAEFPLGTIITTRAEGFAYEVVTSDPDLTTAGGTMLRALPGADGIDPVALGLRQGAGLTQGQIAANDAIMLKALSRGLPIRFGPGTYEMNSVALPGGELSICGKGTTIIKRGETRHLFHVPLGTVQSTLHICGLTLDGDCWNETSRDPTSSLVYFGADTGRLSITDCHFKDPRGRGIYARSTGLTGAATISVRGNRFSGGKEAEMNPAAPSSSKTTQYVSVVDCADFDVSHNHFDLGRIPVGHGLAAIVATTFDRNNALIPGRGTIIGNQLRNLGQAGSVTGAGALGAIEFYQGAGYGVITGNRLIGGCGRQIGVKADTGMTVISGNIIHNMRDLSGIANTDMGPAIVVNGSVEHTGSVEAGYIISDNNIRICPKEGIFITGYAAHGPVTAGDFRVQGNVIAGCEVGIRVRNLVAASIHGNTISVCRSHGIDFKGVSTAITVRDNDIACGGWGIAQFGNGDGGTNVIAQNNRVRGTPSIASSFAAGGILCDANHSALISGNDIRFTTGAAVRLNAPSAKHVVVGNNMGPNCALFVQTLGGTPGAVVSTGNFEHT